MLILNSPSSLISIPNGGVGFEWNSVSASWSYVTLSLNEGGRMEKSFPGASVGSGGVASWAAVLTFTV